MTYTEQAIQKSIKGGFMKGRNIEFNLIGQGIVEEKIKGLENESDDDFSERKTIALEVFFCNPLFWQCLGKTEGWPKGRVCVECKDDGDGCDCLKPTAIYSEYQQHRFIDHLNERKDAESFFKELLTKK